MTRRSPLSILLSLAVPFSVAVASPFVATSALAEPPPADAPAAAEAEAPEATPVALDAGFQRFVLSPHGDVVGVVLDTGDVVHVSPRAFREAPVALKAGDALHIEGIPAVTPTGTVFERAVVQLDGKVLSDTMKRHGHHHRHGKGEHKGEHGKRHEKRAELQPVRAAGRIAALVSGPHGHVRTVLLDDGTSASGFGMDKLGLKVGDRVTVAGMGGAYTQGKAMRIQTITLPNGETRELPKPDWKARHHAKDAQPGAPA
jgi:hypothetical protein